MLCEDELWYTSHGEGDLLSSLDSSIGPPEVSLFPIKLAILIQDRTYDHGIQLTATLSAVLSDPKLSRFANLLLPLAELIWTNWTRDDRPPI